MKPDWTGRAEALAARWAAHGVDALLVSAPANVTYLTGFAGSAGLLLALPHQLRLIVDGRYESAVRDGISSGNLASLDVVPVAAGYDAALASVLDAYPVGRLGFEAGHVTVAGAARWQTLRPAVQWIATQGLVEDLRIIKDASEQAVLREAGRRLAGVAVSIADWVRTGRTELEIAHDLDGAIRRAGFSRPAFETIVASGPNTAYPHARPTDRRLESGDLVLLDFGGVLGGYCVDLTRMAAIGQPGGPARALFEAVREAQASAIDAVRPGIPASDVDSAARDVLERRGLGPAFVHGTGHGLGLEVHEAPRLGRALPEAAEPPVILAAGMVCTVEPGVYVPGLGGVRIEDDVLVTMGGAEVLTEAPRDLLVV